MSHNGWTNYATWRVNLEMFDGLTPSDVTGRRVNSPLELAEALKEMAESNLDVQGKGLVLDYALAFLSDVNWHEIANAMLADNEDEAEEPAEEEV